MTQRRLPAPRTPDPMAAPPLRWGILAPGWIAGQFAAALRRGTRQRIAAVGSRNLDRARAFADEHGAPTAYGSYDELATTRTSTSSTSPHPTPSTTAKPGSPSKQANPSWWRRRSPATPRRPAT